MADDLQTLTSLYDRDYVAWAEQQSAALRARSGGDNALDYDNLAEEIEDLGKSETRACESQIENIVEHLLKIEFVGPRQTIPHWSGEIIGFRRELAKRLTRTIENRVKPDLQDVFDYVLKSLATRKLVDPSTVMAARGTYPWDQIVDPDWFPEPRYPD